MGESSNGVTRLWRPGRGSIGVDGALRTGWVRERARRKLRYREG
jgi:hypothetical protein